MRFQNGQTIIVRLGHTKGPLTRALYREMNLNGTHVVLVAGREFILGKRLPTVEAGKPPPLIYKCRAIWPLHAENLAFCEVPFDLLPQQKAVDTVYGPYTTFQRAE